VADVVDISGFKERLDSVFITIWKTTTVTGLEVRIFRLVVFDRGVIIARHPVRHVPGTQAETTFLLLPHWCTDVISLRPAANLP
jgi:hypothetical protein